MGLFSKKNNLKPVLETQGLRIEYDSPNENWQFTFEGVEFVSYGARLLLPPAQSLATIVADIEKLRPEMMRRLAEGWKEWDNVRTNDGETFLVNITDLQSEGSFVVTWDGGKSWGDMGIDFTIKDQEIKDESWGD